MRNEEQKDGCEERVKRGNAKRGNGSMKGEWRVWRDE